MGDERFDAVVVGSGFGGAVMAYRLAAAGQRVCLLERGQAWPAGSFPRSVHGVGHSVWDPSAKRWGFWDLWSFSRYDAAVASGLGGGSLLFANVLLRKPAEWFYTLMPDGTKKPWPITRAELEPHYDAVEAMLVPQRYPHGIAPYDLVPKVRAFRDAATRLGLRVETPPLAVHFSDPSAGGPPQPGAPLTSLPPNLHGVPRTSCTLCGDCTFGCNGGAKNSLDYNYLSRAKLDHGADVRPLCEVKAFHHAAGEWTIEYVRRFPGADPARREHTLRARRLILSAGALGTPYLLLKMARQGGLRLSDALGTRVTGNGDLFAVMMGANHASGAPFDLQPGRGPAITTAVRVPLDDHKPDGPGFYVQEAVSPDWLSWMVEFMNTPGVLWRALRLAWDWLRSRGKDPDISAEVSRFFGGATLSSTSLPLLAMGMDVPTGRMTLDRQARWMDVSWDKGPNAAYFARLEQVIGRLAETIGGEIKFTSTGKKRTFTVHPLGGCPMGAHAGEGVVDAHGRVFDPAGGVIPGLYVADGSVMPGPVGPNPSLTIAALADRFADHLLDEVSGTRA
jgi:cholesterol oxidase